MTGQRKKKNNTMINIDPIEQAESFGTGKRLNGEIEEEVMVSEVKEVSKDQAIDASSHHRRDE